VPATFTATPTGIVTATPLPFRVYLPLLLHTERIR